MSQPEHDAEVEAILRAQEHWDGSLCWPDYLSRIRSAVQAGREPLMDRIRARDTVLSAMRRVIDDLNRRIKDLEDAIAVTTNSRNFNFRGRKAAEQRIEELVAYKTELEDKWIANLQRIADAKADAEMEARDIHFAIHPSGVWCGESPCRVRDAISRAVQAGRELGLRGRDPNVMRDETAQALVQEVVMLRDQLDEAREPLLKRIEELVAYKTELEDKWIANLQRIADAKAEDAREEREACAVLLDELGEVAAARIVRARGDQ